MKRKLATADFSFPLLGHDEVIQLIGLLDFDGVDIGLFEGRSHLWPSREFRHVKKSAKELRKKIKGAGLKPADVFLQMAPDFVPFAANHPEASRRKKARNWFEKTLEYAHELGCEHVTSLPGVTFESEDHATSLGRCREELAWRVSKAEDAGITFSVEAHVGSIVPTPPEAKALVESVPGLTLTLDYTHFTRAGLPDRDVEPLIDHASHFHVRGAAKGRLQTSFKNNAIDYKRVLQRMNRAGYKGWLGVEYVWIDWEHCNEVDNLSETIQFRDFLRRTKV
jgi:sugar phosphate isomerase/epimerase